jgi:hypothetical protein
MDCLDSRNAEDTGFILAMILSDDVNYDDSIDDETESDDASYVEPRERGAECTGDTTSDDDCCS